MLTISIEDDSVTEGNQGCWREIRWTRPYMSAQHKNGGGTCRPITAPIGRRQSEGGIARS
jgi:hypothetical protein